MFLKKVILFRKQLQTDMADPELRLFTENGHKIFLAVHEQNPHFILGMAGARLILEDGKVELLKIYFKP